MLKLQAVTDLSFFLRTWILFSYMLSYTIYKGVHTTKYLQSMTIISLQLNAFFGYTDNNCDSNVNSCLYHQMLLVMPNWNSCWIFIADSYEIKHFEAGRRHKLVFSMSLKIVFLFEKITRYGCINFRSNCRFDGLPHIFNLFINLSRRRQNTLTGRSSFSFKLLYEGKR